MSDGCNQNSSGVCSEAEGSNTTASGFASHTEGIQTQANFGASHAEGFQTQTNEAVAHAEGYDTKTNAPASHSEGSQTQANGRASHSEGSLTIAGGDSSHAEGSNTWAMNQYAHSEGNLTVASGIASHVEGGNTVASGLVSHAEGQGTRAQGESSHPEGDQKTASGRASHAEGNLTLSEGIFAHAEGQRTVARGDLSHAEGNQTQALAQSSHAEGALSIASGFTSHAEGVSTVASGLFSHTEGQSTNANNFEGVHAMGRFGATNELSYSWYLANGTDATAPGLAAKILSNGNVKIDGTVSTSAADYGEMFETIDGNPINFGYFVTLEESKVRIATGQDDYILGITSAIPGFLGDSGELRWKHKFLTNEWGELLSEDVELPTKFDDYGNGIIPQRKEHRPILNPDWDPSMEYIPRLQRKEWVAVGLIGKLHVRDDGTCKAGSYCKPINGGIATASVHGCRVLERTGKNQILILIQPPYRTNISNAEQLEKLAKLKDQGYLTEEEFKTEKQKLLDS